MSTIAQATIPTPTSRHALRSSVGLGWEGFGAELLAFPAGVYQVPASRAHRVAFHVGPPVKARCRCDESRCVRVQTHGDADVVPAGLEGEWIDETDSTILRIWIGEHFARTTFDQLGLKASQALIHPQFQLRDPRLQYLAWGLRAELEAQTPSDPLYAESLCTAMIVRLAGAPPADARRRHTLSPRAAARVVDFIESHLDERLSLATLAALVELSVPHFKALFRETMGMPVHRYVVQRRVERARDLLLQGKLQASQIALETGFSHQSHMAQWMNRLLGATPREIVRSGRQREDDAGYNESSNRLSGRSKRTPR
ncbi:AraC family transcriptional regulator [Trinickia caryophylli]|uniref:Transcriptional regulator, AraC family n=1 Tax=Trinickia caryophylli TaxID=28094 RepID=A0A1X7G240_TRICW|nr:AraC family transcriptional regulator [Trinickia caryophylli]PMS13692.1 AraC family transcriptional regulator [Trinickia caryophylli]TRX14185.1 helix-turn-helix transcriptional regulator [Trinickia caryophylli]WQE14009.1 AraC family transcriptional regulator [Trinickia caryophylli]SMF62656.1 transcriptional regulator, AraC family [Trinickia caryophylli]GLU33507.1 AraC family transcriptional regulator [Trinickia caryophylli]